MEERPEKSSLFLSLHPLLPVRLLYPLPHLRFNGEPHSPIGEAKGSDLSLSIPTNSPVHLKRTTLIGSLFHPFSCGPRLNATYFRPAPTLRSSSGPIITAFGKMFYIFVLSHSLLFIFFSTASSFLEKLRGRRSCFPATTARDAIRSVVRGRVT